MIRETLQYLTGVKALRPPRFVVFKILVLYCFPSTISYKISILTEVNSHLIYVQSLGFSNAFIVEKNTTNYFQSDTIYHSTKDILLPSSLYLIIH